VTHHPRIVVSADDPVFDVAETDPTVAPSDDFYRFANGGWIDANPVPPEYSAWGAAHEVHERNQAILHTLLEAAAADTDADPNTPEYNVGIYYRSGMDVDRIESLGVEPIAAWLERISGIEDLTTLSSLLVDLHRIGVGAFFSVGVLPDFEDATINLLYVGQGGLGLPDRDYYVRDDDDSTTLMEDYRSHVARMFELLGLAAEDARSAADTVLTLEGKIAEVSYTNVQMRDVDLITNKVVMTETRQLMPNLGLDGYLGLLGASGEAAINIDNEGFYPAIDRLITETDLADLKTYLTWHLVASVASSLPSRFEEESFDFYGRKLSGQQEQKARWKRVLAAGSGDIGELIAQLFVRDNFPPEAKASMEHLVNRLFDAMRETIEHLEWMGDDTKVEALAKLAGFGSKIGYPDEWRDYSALELHEGAWLENRLACRAFETQRQLHQLGKPVDLHEWSMAPHVVNAYYHPLRNEIVFPAGILQPPFFTAEADDAVNYGAIGAVIGHEITHGFDDQGSRFDAHGNVRNWWSDEDRAEFDRRAKVMVEQFSAYEVDDGLHVNGELTLGENIADLGGLKIALMALDAELGGEPADVAGLTAAQRFFLAWARVWRKNDTPEYRRLIVNSDPHAPSDLRCKGPMSNLAVFAEAFSIPDDDPSMRQADDRVDIW
jgi:putative endopeptidase